MSTTALFIFTDGLEELEAIAPLDILRRSGVSCTAVSQTSQLEVTGRNGINLKADCLLPDIIDETFDLVVIPGGPGVASLRSDPAIIKLVQRHAHAGKQMAAICAAPTVLNDAGLLDGRSYTAHFTVANELPDIQTAQAVVVDGNITTSRGAGTAVEFGLKLAEILKGAEISREVADSIHYQPANSRD